MADELESISGGHRGGRLDIEPCPSPSSATPEGRAVVRIVTEDERPNLESRPVCSSDAVLHPAEVAARAARLASLGELTTSIAHDLINVLNAIGLQLEVLRLRAKRSEAIDDVVALLATLVGHANDTVDCVQRYAHTQAGPDLELVDLDRVARDAFALVTPRLHPDIVVKRELGRAPQVVARAAEVTNALVNLLLNALDAQSQGGVITVRTGQTPGWSWIEVEDAGTGIPPELLRKIFDPSFTTRRDGTGLGLAAVRSCVRRTGGTLDVESRVGHGTRFRMAFRVPNRDRIR